MLRINSHLNVKKYAWPSEDTIRKQRVILRSKYNCPYYLSSSVYVSDIILLSKVLISSKMFVVFWCLTPLSTIFQLFRGEKRFEMHRWDHTLNRWHNSLVLTRRWRCWITLTGWNRTVPLTEYDSQFHDGHMSAISWENYIRIPTI